MQDRAGHRAALALLGLALALGAILLPPAASVLSGGADPRTAFQVVTVRAFPTTSARPASPAVGTVHTAHRLIGYAAPLARASATPAPLVTALLGSLLIAGTGGRSRLNGNRRRPRGPPAVAAPISPAVAG